MPTEWWESFFTGLWLDAQRQAWPEDQTRAEANFLEKALQVAPTAKILDVPCGEGRLSLELASRGYQVTGVDLTLPLLNDARRKATERQLNIVWEHRDMRDLPWHEEFDGAFCFWGSFGYFDDDGNMAFLRAVSQTLKPGARFLIDTHVVETVLPRFHQRFWRRFGHTLALEEASFDHANSRVSSEWILVQEGKLEKRAVPVAGRRWLREPRGLWVIESRTIQARIAEAGVGRHEKRKAKRRMLSDIGHASLSVDEFVRLLLSNPGEDNGSIGKL